MVVIMVICGPLRCLFKQRFPKTSLFGFCLPCLASYSPEEQPKPSPLTPHHHLDDHKHILELKNKPLDMEEEYAKLQTSQEDQHMGESEDPQTMIR